jgi:two-component system, chemotaxis family, protein-glutamate methylesterase/glutaminase
MIDPWQRPVARTAGEVSTFASAPERQPPRTTALPGPHCVVGLAASAGGIPALTAVLGELPADLAAALLVVQHMDPRHRSWMPEILRRHVGLRVKEAETGDRLVDGTIYVAPPDRHLLVDADGTLSLADTERVRFVRPSADRLFAALAASFGPRAIAVVLTGSGRDGADGVRSVKEAGGRVIVQDLASSEYGGMPGAAIETGAADRVLPLGEIGAALVALVGEG